MKVIDGIKGKDAFDKNIIYAVENEDKSFYIIAKNQMVAHIVCSEPHKNRYYADLFARALRDGVREKCETCKKFGACQFENLMIPRNDYKKRGCNFHERKETP